MIQQREQWGSNLGFILAAVGSAVGIGNIWRFPYIVGTNGGGAFLVTYFIVVFSFGLTFMLLELAVGRRYQSSILSAFEKIRKRFKWIGLLTVIVTFAILSYYLVILGWILSYLVISLLDIEGSSFESYVSTIYPVFSFVAVLLINYGIISLGVSRGIEKINKFGVLLLMAILIPLTAIAVSLEGSEKGLEFYLTPDFTTFFDPETWSISIGQAFFSLSVGMGVLLAYGSYLGRQQQRSLLGSSLVIIVADVAIAFTAGLMIFSFVFANDMAPDQGTSLIFRVMPAIFTEMQFGLLVGSMFFFLLLLAGLTSSISMFQMPVSVLEDTFNFTKRRATAMVAALLFLVGLPSALSYSSLNLVLQGSQPVLDVFDMLFGTYGVAISGTVLVIITAWFMNKKELLEQVNRGSRIRIPAWAIPIIKVLMPVLIIGAIVSQLLT